MYPLATLQATNPGYALLATFNPLSYVTDLFRWGTNVTTSVTSPLTPSEALIAVLVIVAFFGFFTLLGVTLYDRHIEGGGWQ